MAILTSNRGPGEVVLETRVRELAASGLSGDSIVASLRADGVGSDRDALWLYSWVIADRERGGLGPRVDLPSLE
jgi:hypothetical protein